MLKLTLRTLNANKIRLALTTFAVVLGVSFVVSSFVLGDGLRQSFGSLSTEIVGDTDLEVRPASDFGSPQPLDDSLEEAIEGIGGVRNAEGLVIAENIQPIKADGTPVSTVGPPLIGFSWVDDPALSSFAVVEGRPPQSGREFTIDETAAASGGFLIGEQYGVITPTGRAELTLVGTTRFGDSNETLGAVLTQYPLDTAQQLFAREGQFDSVVVSFESGADAETIQGAVAALVPAGAEVLDQQELLDDTKADFNEGINIFNNVLLGFAVVALFVSIFIIANTFVIVLGQRTKELALLRALGASPSQVRRSAMGEALVVGVIAAALGIVGGLGLNYGLRAMFAALDAELPDSPVILASRTIVVAVIVGVGVTLMSAFGPARRASRVAPIAAMQDANDAPRERDHRRFAVGAVLFLVGAVLGVVGLFGDPGGVAVTLFAIGGGAGIIFVGLAMLSPAVARPVIELLGVPVRSLGVAGRLSTRNASRNPRRTSSTAASLMVGLALVTTALVVGESIKRSIGDTLASAVQADYISSTDTPITPVFIDRLAESAAFDAVAGYRYEEVRVGTDVRGVIGADLEATAMLFDLDVSNGALDNGSDSVVVHQDEADDRGLAVGDSVDVTFPAGSVESLTVAAIFDSDTIMEEPYLVGLDRWEQRFGATSEVWWAAAMIADGVPIEQAEAALTELEAQYPQVVFESQIEFKESIEAEVDQLLVAVNAMLVLAIVIALVGIANTLALSVFERTRELGLLRAVGMTRRQTRRMIRWEAAQVSVFGSVLGIGVGLVFGWGAVSALPDSFVSTLAVPTSRIAILVAVCAIAGLIAAAFPARRASRLDVLEAISHA